MKLMTVHGLHSRVRRFLQTGTGLAKRWEQWVWILYTIFLPFSTPFILVVSCSLVSDFHGICRRIFVACFWWEIMHSCFPCPYFRTIRSNRRRNLWSWNLRQIIPKNNNNKHFHLFWYQHRPSGCVHCTPNLPAVMQVDVCDSALTPAFLQLNTTSSMLKVYRQLPTPLI
jgi:hypothetical protein